MTTDVEPDATTRAIVDSSDAERVVLRVSGTDYRLRLRLVGGAGVAADVVAGQRTSGVVEADALRVHAAAGGGRFIEPVDGEPRIVAGTVRAIDETHHRLLIAAAVPMWLKTEPGQDFAPIKAGGLVNCYVKDARFTPTA